VKVISFNIRSEPLSRNRWARRRDPIANLLLRHQPDLAGIQEATLPMLHDLHERLGGYRWVGVGRDDGKEAGEFTPIFVRADRWEIEEHASFWLAAVCDLPGRGWDAVCCRTVTWARLLHKEANQHCYHFNTHLDHMGRDARAQSALLLLQKIYEIARDEPVIVTGDFNCGESSTPYQILTGKIPFSGQSDHYGHLRDAFYDSKTPPEGPRKTYQGLLSFFGIGRIDYAFLKNAFQTRRYEVLREAGRASDHRPVLVELDFATRAA
jgi:endonuclease/exonuclease/phosphatase family metal-dependent hydrolase